MAAVYSNGNTLKQISGSVPLRIKRLQIRASRTSGIELRTIRLPMEKTFMSMRRNLLENMIY